MTARRFTPHDRRIITTLAAWMAVGAALIAAGYALPDPYRGAAISLIATATLWPAHRAVMKAAAA